jgi:hypothetical protein
MSRISSPAARMAQGWSSTCADERIGEKDAAVFAATAQVCAQLGWGYQRAGELGPVTRRPFSESWPGHSRMPAPGRPLRPPAGS